MDMVPSVVQMLVLIDIHYTAGRISMNKSMLKQNGESSCGGGPYIFQTCTPPSNALKSIAMAVSSCTKVLSSWPTMCLCLLPCFA